MSERRLDLGWLRIVEAIGRLGSLTRAADELGLSQPAVSYQIRRLEERLGVALIERMHRGSRLTEAGETLQRAVRLGVEGIDAAARAIRQRARTPVIRIFTDYGFAAFWLMPRVAEFRRLRPEVEVHVVASQGLGEALEDQADIAVVFGARKDLAGEGVLIMPERVVPVCSPGFVARRGPFGDAGALAAVPLLHLDTAGPARWFTWSSWLETQGVSRGPARGDLGFNTYGFVIEAALAEQGVALGWLGLVDTHLANRTLVAVGPEASRPDCGYWLTVGAGGHPAAAALAEWLTGAGREVVPGKPAQ